MCIRDRVSTQSTWGCFANIFLKNKMKLNRFLLRYFPPGIILEYLDPSGNIESRNIDLLTLTPETNVDDLIYSILSEEPFLEQSHKPQLKSLIEKLIDKIESKKIQTFIQTKSLSHTLPLCDVAINKMGDRFISGSYDRTCKVWDTHLGKEVFSLSDHKNVVYCIAFDYPVCGRIATGSFDRTAKIWDANIGKLCHSLVGHREEVVCISFDPQGMKLFTGSMVFLLDVNYFLQDHTAKIWDTNTGKEILSLQEHTAEVVSLHLNRSGDRLITGSFDYTAKIWDVESGKCLFTLGEHEDDLTKVQFNFTGDYCATASKIELARYGMPTLVSVSRLLEDKRMK
eukprot:TRINITY_DN404_c0_g1_i1.p1 TRINITY_DN404_c0_g1~~TRINITY_DN404_c0_g1_i1.p1  ORF type:complete len:357 (-),score=36.87 TRINITY_DN404_c0_g1_i1:485-1507(-)